MKNMRTHNSNERQDWWSGPVWMAEQIAPCAEHPADWFSLCQVLLPWASVFPREVPFSKAQKAIKRITVTLLTSILVTKLDSIFPPFARTVGAEMDMNLAVWRWANLPAWRIVWKLSTSWHLTVNWTVSLLLCVTYK